MLLQVHYMPYLNFKHMSTPENADTAVSIITNWTQIVATVSGTLLTLIGLLAGLWKLLTKNIMDQIKGKADQKDLDHLTETVKVNSEDIDKLENLERDTNNKVNDIWKYVVLGKLKFKNDDEVEGD